MTDLTERLRRLKHEHRAAAKEIANAVGVSPTTVHNWLSGTMPKSNHIAKLSEYFGVTADYLVNGLQPKKRVAAISEINQIITKLSQSQLDAILIIARELAKKS
ncbi:hypothetical protein B0T40_03350 [Chromobacterium haemolyticum]|uniref:helix-turn-helix domain-containing protein n=1 Tax=Chromobacterium haemolyticum TaxID=394935 RepID=UPI0009EFD804|nr:helix-turn-helix transcriptional regulator [Chromobacterium haemolyticum]OQS39783.1 hypothetical protein B0T40_03350 [Chromobacterium haemolyticum]